MSRPTPYSSLNSSQLNHLTRLISEPPIAQPNKSTDKRPLHLNNKKQLTVTTQLTPTDIIHPNSRKPLTPLAPAQQIIARMPTLKTELHHNFPTSSKQTNTIYILTYRTIPIQIPTNFQLACTTTPHRSITPDISSQQHTNPELQHRKAQKHMPRMQKTTKAQNTNKNISSQPNSIPTEPIALTTMDLTHEPNLPGGGDSHRTQSQDSRQNLITSYRKHINYKEAQMAHC